jgi:hypothetical protein
MFNSSPTTCNYIPYFFLYNVSSRCFGCYLHPSSGAQLQHTAIGFVSVENRGFWYQVLWMIILYGFVCTRFSEFRVIFTCWCVCVCVIRSVLVLRGHDVWFFRRWILCYICVLAVLVCYSIREKNNEYSYI